MKPVPPPDHHHLEATIGWLMLGNLAEARAEFAQVAPAYRQHPQTLYVEWRLLSDGKQWELAIKVAEAHIAADLNDVTGYIHRSFALHELKRTAEALEKLCPAAERFPEEPTIPYNLACYTCQLGDLESARRWLIKSFTLESEEAGRQKRRIMALEDPDLRPLWPELRTRKDWW